MKVENDNDKYKTFPAPEQEQLTNIVGNRRFKLRNAKKQRLHRKTSQKHDAIYQE